jgi:hypothetical protein
MTLSCPVSDLAIFLENPSICLKWKQEEAAVSSQPHTQILRRGLKSATFRSLRQNSLQLMFYTLLFAAACFKGNWVSGVIFFYAENFLSKNSFTGSFRSNKKVLLYKKYVPI